MKDVVKINHGPNGFERDYSKYNYKSSRRHHVPTWDEYKKVLSEKIEDSRLYYLIRLGHELGISPYAVVNLRKIHFCSMQPRSIFVEVAKSIKRFKKSAPVMRSRLLPINDSLYAGLKEYIKTHDSKYLVPNKKGYNCLTVCRICQMFQSEGIGWTPHKSRSFFKNQMKTVLIPLGMYDEGEVRKIMGHQPRDSGERYDDLNFELACLYVNKVFAERL